MWNELRLVMCLGDEFDVQLLIAAEQSTEESQERCSLRSFISSGRHVEGYRISSNCLMLGAGRLD